MNKRGFTLFEVLVSLVILSVIMLSLTKLYREDNSLKIYYELQSIENSYIETQTVTNTKNIKLNHN